MIDHNKTTQQETYEYYDLPFCKPVGGVETRRRGQSLGEQLEGHELINSGLKLRCGDRVGVGVTFSFVQLEELT